MVRPLYLTVGVVAAATGFVGVFLPLVPTVPLMLLAAYCFARSNPAWERRLLDHPRFGPPIRTWRERGAIPRRAKAWSTVLVGISAVTGAIWLEGAWRFVGPAIGTAVLAWMWTRPEA